MDRFQVSTDGVAKPFQSMTGSTEFSKSVTAPGGIPIQFQGLLIIRYNVCPTGSAFRGKNLSRSLA